MFLLAAPPTVNAARWEVRHRQDLKPLDAEASAFSKNDGILLYSAPDQCFYVTEFQCAIDIHNSSKPDVSAFIAAKVVAGNVVFQKLSPQDQVLFNASREKEGTIS